MAKLNTKIKIFKTVLENEYITCKKFKRLISDFWKETLVTEDNT